MKNITLIAMEESMDLLIESIVDAVESTDDRDMQFEKVKTVLIDNGIIEIEESANEKNKPRWKNLDMWERLARRCKQSGCSEDTVEHIREHGKQRKEK